MSPPHCKGLHICQYIILNTYLRYLILQLYQGSGTRILVPWVPKHDHTISTLELPYAKKATLGSPGPAQELLKWRAKILRDIFPAAELRLILYEVRPEAGLINLLWSFSHGFNVFELFWTSWNPGSSPATYQIWLSDALGQHAVVSETLRLYGCFYNLRSFFWMS